MRQDVGRASGRSLTLAERPSSSLVGVSLGLILYQASAILPFSSMRNAERMMPMYLRAVHRLLAPHAERLGDGVVGVGEQREAEAVLLVELRLLRRLVGADAERRRCRRCRRAMSRSPHACVVQPGVSAFG